MVECRSEIRSAFEAGYRYVVKEIVSTDRSRLVKRWHPRSGHLLRGGGKYTAWGKWCDDLLCRYDAAENDAGAWYMIDGS